jgi:hypothetical protein
MVGLQIRESTPVSGKLFPEPAQDRTTPMVELIITYTVFTIVLVVYGAQV